MSAGTEVSPGSYQLSVLDLVGLTVTPTIADDFMLSVTASVSDASSGTSAETNATLFVDVIPNPLDGIV